MQDTTNTRPPIGYTLRDLQRLQLPPLEHVLYGLPRGCYGMVNATTDAGKSTLFRNLALSAASGRQFPPLFTGTRPLRVAILDFEDPTVAMRSDLATMLCSLPPEAQEAVQDRLYIATEIVTADDELLTLNERTEFRRVVAELKEFAPDLVLVDTLSSAFILE
ncbi:MAG: AAA family ATPase, partial [Acidobacteria bacterium]|nr:AAA family ATPase [Acidobacteriota bacterium]